MKRELILVDGYNFLHQIPHFKRFLRQGIEAAREEVIQEFLRYSDFQDREIRIVFDSRHAQPSEEKYFSNSGFTVVFSGRKQTADTYIERFIYERAKPFSLRVISADRKIQHIAFGKDVWVSSPEVFYEEMKAKT